MDFTTLQKYLLDQLDSLPEEERRVGRVRKLIAFVDQNGYINGSLADIAETTRERVEDLERSLKALQTLQPVGVGARCLQECLRLQANAHFPPDHPIYVLIDHHLEDLEFRRLSAISKSTGLDESTIKEVLGMLRNFDPKPGQSIGRSK